jgi:hypothetical protein
VKGVVQGDPRNAGLIRVVVTEGSADAPPLVLIEGLDSRNRAFAGDTVFAELLASVPPQAAARQQEEVARAKRQAKLLNKSKHKLRKYEAATGEKVSQAGGGADGAAAAAEPAAPELKQVFGRVVRVEPPSKLPAQPVQGYLFLPSRHLGLAASVPAQRDLTNAPVGKKSRPDAILPRGPLKFASFDRSLPMLQLRKADVPAPLVAAMAQLRRRVCLQRSMRRACALLSPHSRLFRLLSRAALSSGLASPCCH